MRCPACDYELQNATGPCPACGHRATTPGPYGGAQNPFEAPRAQPEAPFGAPEADASSIPWEVEYTVPNLLETIKRVTLETSDTFARAPRDVGLNAALLYALLMGGVFGLVGTLLQSLIIPQAAGEIPGEFAPVVEALTQPGLSSVITVPIQVVVATFVGAAIVHVGLMIVGGANSGFEATFRVVAFVTGSIAPLQIIPVLGPLIGAIWGLVLEVLALKELHDTTGGKAAFGVLLPLGLVCLCGGIAAIFAGAIIAGIAR